MLCARTGLELTRIWSKIQLPSYLLLDLTDWGTAVAGKWQPANRWYRCPQLKMCDPASPPSEFNGISEFTALQCFALGGKEFIRFPV